MSKRRFVTVWDAIEGTPEEAENMKLRSALKSHLRRNEEVRFKRRSFLASRSSVFLTPCAARSTCSASMRWFTWRQPQVHPEVVAAASDP